MDSRYQRGQPSSGELVRSMALSSAELWHEILERLHEMQESQAKLASAIEGLSVMFKDAIAPDDQPIVGAHSRGVARARGELPTFATAPTLPPETEPALPVPVIPDAPASQEAASETEPDADDEALPFKAPDAPAETSRDDARDTATPSGSQTADVSDPAFAPEIPEPLFYVPPLGEDVLTLSAVVDLTPSALDAVLAAEFNDVEQPSVTDAQPSVTDEQPSVTDAQPPVTVAQPSVTDARQPATAPPVTGDSPEPKKVEAYVAEPEVLRVASAGSWSTFDHGTSPDNGTSPENGKNGERTTSSATLGTNDPVQEKGSAGKPKGGDPSEVLDILLGTPMKSPTVTSTGEPAPVVVPEPPTPAFELPPPPAPTFESSRFSAPPPPPPPPTFEAAPSPPPPPPPSTTFESAATLLPPPPPPPPTFGAAPSPPPPPPLSTTFESAATLPPPPPAPTSSTFESASPVAESALAPLVFETAPAPTPPPPPALTFEAAPSTPAPTDEQDRETDEHPDLSGSRSFSSAASMATEILSASPEPAEPESRTDGPASSLVSEDLTLIARGRRKRFRMR